MLPIFVNINNNILLLESNMKLLLENTVNGDIKKIPVGNFSWEIFFLGWVFWPYIKYKLWTPVIIYSILLFVTSILFLFAERLIPFPIDIINFCFSSISINIILMCILHSYWAGVGERECLRYHLDNKWKIVNNSQAAKIALISLGIIQ